ncbi:hypothetical protein GCM10028798_25860 [Humibacter antri]
MCVVVWTECRGRSAPQGGLIGQLARLAPYALRRDRRDRGHLRERSAHGHGRGGPGAPGARTYWNGDRYAYPNANANQQFHPANQQFHPAE